MEKRILGETGLCISTLSFGGMELGHLYEEYANKVLNTALDMGINYIDTCPEYPKSEIYIGDSISKRRDEYILATKCGDNMTGIGSTYQWDRKTMMENLEHSLRLMKTDYIDVWQLHAIMPEYIENGQNDDIFRCMEDAKKAGKIRFIGATLKNGRPDEKWHPSEFGYHGLKQLMNWEIIDVIQIVYGGLTRRSELCIEEAAKKGKGIVARGIVKKYFDWYDDVFEKSNIKELFEENETKFDFLIRFALSNKSLTTSLIGTKNIDHLIRNIKTAEKGGLSSDIYNEAKRRLSLAGAIPGALDEATSMIPDEYIKT